MLCLFFKWSNTPPLAARYLTEAVSQDESCDMQGIGMKRRKRKIITIAIIVILGALIGSGLTEETFVKLNMAMKIPRTLDYYEYHERGDKDSRLLSMCLYSWQKQGTQRKCREYIPISSVEAVLASYTLEGYDDKGNCVYQKQLTTEGTEETYWTYVYDGQGRIAEKGTWIMDRDSEGERNTCQIRKYHYYENGMSADAVYDYGGDAPAASPLGVVFYDRDGHELLHKTYGNKEGVQDTDQATLWLGTYGREELVCEEDRLVAYRWYDYDRDGNISFLLEITPEGTDPVRYLCTYTIYRHGVDGRLEAAYRYEPVKQKYPNYYVHYRSGDIDTGIYLDYDEDGRLFEFASVYFMDEDQPGEVLYYIFLQEDGTFELAGR